MLDGSMKQMKDLNQTIGEKIIYIPPSGGHKEESENAWGIRPKHGEVKKKKKNKNALKWRNKILHKSNSNHKISSVLSFLHFSASLPALLKSCYQCFSHFSSSSLTSWLDSGCAHSLLTKMYKQIRSGGIITRLPTSSLSSFVIIYFISVVHSVFFVLKGVFNLIL